MPRLVRIRIRVLVLAVLVLLLAACTSADEEAGPTTAPSAAPIASEVATSEGARDLGASAPPPGSATASPSPVPTTPLPSGSWTLLADARVPLTEVAAAPLAGQIWVVGGYTADGTPTDEVQVYDPAFDAWSAGPPLPEAVHHAALVSDGTRLLAIGGFAASGGFAPSAAVHVLDPTSGLWEDGPPLPSPRAAGGAAWDGMRVVYGGGVDAAGVRGEVFALVDGSWEELGTLATPREHLAAASDGSGSTWLLGGRDAGLEGNRGEVDLVTGARIRELGQLPTPRGGVRGFYAPGIGGCSVGGEGPEGTFREVECMDADGMVTVLPPLAEPRHGIGAVTLEGLAYVLLGGPEPGLTVSGTLQALALDAP